MGDDDSWGWSVWRKERVIRSTVSFAMACGAVLVGFASRQLLDPWLHEAVSFGPFVPAVAVCLLVYALGPALLATAGPLLFGYYAVELTGGLLVHGDALTLLLLIVAAGAVAAAGSLHTRLHRSLRQSEERFRVVLDTVPDIILMVEPNGNAEFFNSRFQSATGLAAPEAQGFGWSSVLHPDDKEAFRALLKPGGDAGMRQRELRLRLREGSYRWFAVRAQPFREGGIPAHKWLVVASDVDEIVRRSRELQHMTDELELAMSAGRLARWEYDDQSGTFAASKEFWDFLGVDSPTGGSLADLVAALAPGEKTRFQAGLDRCISRGEVIDSEFRVVLPDGRTRCILINGAARTEEGRRLIGVAADSTERSEASRQHAERVHQEMMIAELRHRIGNIFPIVLSLIQLTAAADSRLAGFRESLTARIRSLAATYDLTARDGSQSVTFRELVLVELAPYFSADRVEVLGPEVRLYGGMAENFAILLHELATNSTKYGSLSNQSGCLSVAWALDPPDGEPVAFRLDWIERGGPAAQAPEQVGLGSAIIGWKQAPLVGGAADIRYEPEGLRYSLTVPFWGDRSALPRR